MTLFNYVKESTNYLFSQKFDFNFYLIHLISKLEANSLVNYLFKLLVVRFLPIISATTTPTRLFNQRFLHFTKILNYGRYQ